MGSERSLGDGEEITGKGVVKSKAQGSTLALYERGSDSDSHAVILMPQLPAGIIMDEMSLFITSLFSYFANLSAVGSSIKPTWTVLLSTQLKRDGIRLTAVQKFILAVSMLQTYPSRL